jgi:RNA methyltransferase, TrmH family
MKTITSRQNPAVRAFRELAEHPDRAGARLLLDGVHLVGDAADAGIDIEVACVATSRLEHPTEEAALAATLAAGGVEVIAVPDQVFATVSPVRTPSGIAAIGRRTPASAADICAHPAPLIIVAVDVQDPGNVGAVIRVGEAAGATGVFVTGASANPFSWKALRGSMGSALRLPVVSSVNIIEVLTCLRLSHIRSICAVARDGTDPDAQRWDGGIGILVGGEGPGLSEDVIAACNERVTIPMAPRVESLNVAVAAAVLLYTARRHRSMPG